MARQFWSGCVMATLCGLAPGAAGLAQNTGNTGKSWSVPAAVAAQPFRGESKRPHTVRAIEFLPQGRMSAQDKLIAADAESSVAERAHWSGLSFEDGNWSYQQVLCPSLPEHLFLRFTRNNGAHDVTVFSASVPRDGERVRIIPILKRSYSLFAPAPINALTISAFNHIRAEEHGGDNADWLEDGLCYAALAGANPARTPPDARPSLQRPVPAVTAVLVLKETDGEEMRFADAAGKPKPVEWTLIFNRKGKLTKVVHTLAPMRTIHPVPSRSPVERTWTVAGPSNE